MAQAHAMQMVVPSSTDGEGSTDIVRPEVGADVAGKGSPLSAPDQGVGNVDKIRDILFGSQMRDYESRFARLEDNVAKELADLRESARKRADAIETYVKRELESLQARLKNEREERAESVRQVNRELAELGETLVRRITELDEHTLQIERQLRLELLQISKTFTEDLCRKQDETAAVVERRFQELRKAKTDRAALAALFTELGMRLNNEFPVAAAAEA